jgi:hypothetical protein
VLTSLVANRAYRTWPLVVGTIFAGILFLLGFVFFVLSLLYLEYHLLLFIVLIP